LNQNCVSPLKNRFSTALVNSCRELQCCERQRSADRRHRTLGLKSA
jgi:hypothetical protein